MHQLDLWGVRLGSSLHTGQQQSSSSSARPFSHATQHSSSSFVALDPCALPRPDQQTMIVLAGKSYGQHASHTKPPSAFGPLRSVVFSALSCLLLRLASAAQSVKRCRCCPCQLATRPAEQQQQQQHCRWGAAAHRDQETSLLLLLLLPAAATAS